MRKIVPPLRENGKEREKEREREILDLCATSQLCSMIRSVQEPPILKVHIRRMLMVPDWILGGWGHS